MSDETVRYLVVVWDVAGWIYGKRLQTFLPEHVSALERHKELQLAPQGHAAEVLAAASPGCNTLSWSLTRSR